MVRPSSRLRRLRVQPPGLSCSGFPTTPATAAPHRGWSSADAIPWSTVNGVSIRGHRGTLADTWAPPSQDTHAQLPPDPHPAKSSLTCQLTVPLPVAASADAWMLVTVTDAGSTNPSQ